MKNVWRFSSALLLAAAMTSASLPTTVFASEQQTTVTTYGYDNNEPYESQTTLYDAEGNPVSIGNTVDFNSDIAGLKAAMLKNNQPAGASKNGAFANETDASNGIAQLTLDAVGNTQEQAAYDVVLVLDESGSMCLKSDYDNANNVCPDLNEDHYYYIPAGLFGNENEIYFKLNSIGNGSIAFTPWYTYGDAWEAMKTSLHLNTTMTFTEAIGAWKPWNNLYSYNNDGTYTKITFTRADSSAADTSKSFYSPNLNTSGSIDRMMVEKQEAASLVNTIANTDADARVAVVGFSGSVDDANGRTNLNSTKTNLNAVYDAINHYSGGNDTNYADALNEAYKILNASSESNRQKYVVFITDGNPYYSVRYSGYNDVTGHQAEVTAENKLKSIATVYAAGINISLNPKIDFNGVPTALSNVASTVNGKKLFQNCTTVSSFKSFVNSIATTISHASTLTDTIGADYGLYIDQDHPLTLSNANGVFGTYTSVADLPSQVQYSETGNTVIYQIPNELMNDGVRMSFYVQLDETKRSAASESGIYNTNGDADLTYVRTVNGSSDTTTISLPSPSIHYSISHFPAALTSDKMTDNDPAVMGKTVTDGDKITYTITVTNNGDVNAANIAVKDLIPLNTKFDSFVGTNGIYDGTSVVWTIPELDAGKSTTVSYSVKVNDGIKASSAREEIDDTFTWGWGVEEVSTCLGNKLANPTPEKPTQTIVIPPVEPRPDVPTTDDKDTPDPVVTPKATEPAVTPRPAMPETTDTTPVATEDRPSTPKTGDATNAGAAAGLLGASLIAVMGVILCRKKFSE